MPNNFKNITLEEAQELIDHNITIVDIRDFASYQSAHIINALHINDSNIGDFVLSHDFEKPILIYCYHGHSSQDAASFLIDQGFDEVYSLIGGYAAWSTQGHQ